MSHQSHHAGRCQPPARRRRRARSLAHATIQIALLLYYAVSPVLRLRFPGEAAWHGDWVWPAAIGSGMVWSLGFLAAGAVDLRLAARNTRLGVRRAVYVLLLWGWALGIWGVILAVNVGAQAPAR